MTATHYCTVSHITPCLYEQDKLPIKFQIEFRIILLAFKTIHHGLGPKYIWSLNLNIVLDWTTVITATSEYQDSGYSAWWHAELSLLQRPSCETHYPTNRPAHYKMLKMKKRNWQKWVREGGLRETTHVRERTCGKVWENISHWIRKWETMGIDLDERNGRRGKERYCALLQRRVEYLAVLYLQRGTIIKETI